MRDFSFPKQERIVSQKLIDELFSKSGSQSVVAFPVRAVYREAETTQVLMSVPKKRFKHAVDRNRVKRQLREAYRHHKHLLEGRSLAIAFIWISDTHFSSDVVDKRVKSIIKQVNNRQLTVDS